MGYFGEFIGSPELIGSRLEAMVNYSGVDDGGAAYVYRPVQSAHLVRPFSENSVSYFAVDITKRKGQNVDHSVVGLVVLWHYDAAEYELMYKRVGEEAGPMEVEGCPLRIIRALSPTNSAWAMKWRIRVAQSLLGQEPQAEKVVQDLLAQLAEITEPASV